MNVALRQLTEQYAAQPMIRYIVAVTSSCLYKSCLFFKH